MKNKIRILTLLLLTCITGCMDVWAEDVSSMNLHFVYIAHESTTPVNQLCERIRTLQNDAVEIDDALIVYLSDGLNSPMSFANMRDYTGRGRDTQQAFDSVIGALQDANSHDVVARHDIANILNLFSEYNFLNENREVIYNSVTFDFYVGPSFWGLNNNEAVIAHLYAAFDVQSLPKSKFTLNVYVPRADELKYPEGQPFGPNNIDGINNKVKILKY